MQGILEWLSSLPPLALYLALGTAAALENVFPPIPADTVVAFGSFIAARGEASVVGTFLSTWLGNVIGATAMYVAGRRYGAEYLHKRFTKNKRASKSEARLESLYERYGIWAIMVSRFIPGIRALVPPFAGAARVPAVRAIIAMAIPSGLWYGVVTYLAYTAGSRWEDLQATIGSWGRWTAIGATAIVVMGLVVWLVRRRRSAESASA